MLPATQAEIDHVTSYMEWQAPDLAVKMVQKVYAENVLHVRHDVWDVHTNVDRWWVITEPMNLVKFFRAEADRETMFYPSEWPLPDPGMIWQFSEALGMALIAHADAFPQTLQYFYMPQTGKLDALYNTLARKFERGELGVRFRCVARPASDEGGFYGFERIE
jgi:hypothetical protein